MATLTTANTYYERASLGQIVGEIRAGEDCGPRREEVAGRRARAHAERGWGSGFGYGVGLRLGLAPGFRLRVRRRGGLPAALSAMVAS
eukprot:scaffold36845_cov42-Phaeocystis_antarctica.AAC.1